MTRVTRWIRHNQGNLSGWGSPKSLRYGPCVLLFAFLFQTCQTVQCGSVDRQWVQLSLSPATEPNSGISLVCFMLRSNLKTKKTLGWIYHLKMRWQPSFAPSCNHFLRLKKCRSTISSSSVELMFLKSWFSNQEPDRRESYCWLLPLLVLGPQETKTY